MALEGQALKILQATSRTFYVPISRLPAQLQKAVGAAYLCMRALDEIEDHPTLASPVKGELLDAISLALQANVQEVSGVLGQYRHVLPEVTGCLEQWLFLAPEDIAPRIWEAVASMAVRMAYWARQNWRIQTVADLNRYTFGVAGAVGLLLSDLWAWYDGTQTNRLEAVGFGRGLQAVNILRNRAEDLARGVDFYPATWEDQDMRTYALRNLSLAVTYTQALPPGPILECCRIPLALAYATLDILAEGKGKLSREQALQIIERPFIREP